MEIQHIRHATSILNINGKRLLVDPILSSKGTITPIENVPNQSWNPLVELPAPADTIVNCDAVIVTHTHRDHFDDMATQLIPKHLPIICQPQDDLKIRDLGFLNVTPVNDSIEWNGIKVTRTEGKHGHGVIALKMAPVSGFVLSGNDFPRVYITGDTVWCTHVKKAIKKHSPDIIICNCGEAKFSCGKAITMNCNDILELCKNAPNAKIIAVHMEAWNHCRLSRKSLSDFATKEGIDKQVIIPFDGELIKL
jgi:L-ascorbate metabolism protein UlaG (beta-lactamase superfamily)